MSLTLTKATIDAIQLKTISFDEATTSEGLTSRSSEKRSFREFLGLLDSFPFWFNIVTP